MIDSNENEEKNIQNLNEIPPKDHLKNYQKPPKNYPPIAFGSKSVGFYPVVSEKMP